MRRILYSLALLSGVALALLPGGPAGAEPPEFPDFTFKRVKPPSGASGNRITVQITDPLPPPAQAKPQADVPADPAAGTTASAVYDWFWQDVSPALTDARPDRLDPALVRLSNPPDGQAVPVPRLETLLAITQAHGADILLSTVGTQVSPALALAVIAVESGGRADAISSAGAQGLMQLMPAAGERFGVEDRMNASESIRGGVSYLDRLISDFGGDPVMVLAGYNAGENAVLRHGGVPPYDETRAYVPKVLAAFSVARGLCLTPPVLISDGCAFRQP
ncbi:possible soluble lytic murein transglycosylase [Pseudooceanicola batsensis HTCC2597]|uniref:Possible soluble lytic murein transglycosylase n=1 Tax=Pseudooceanicola batsensis (strain ATCC BAA-863 / DSM 15984 / KCTC 12145 / HTCC2597) TaxID=252305 RepID=A3TZ42_PSEBH|nr:lytic transglycosylase domain-containing protein [Pseudooceanicola batsensis]EAQ02860.1 possible soluble lytic murein transglycosylase [Pseudooceanicola batsensis HTCC2597]